MNERQAELASVLLDGELDQEEQARAVSALLGAGDEALERFGRYRLIGDVMRGESAVLSTSVVRNVREVLQDEPVVLAPRSRAVPRWMRPAAGLAVAASVAVGAVMVAPQLLSPGQPGGQAVQTAAELPRPDVAPTLVAAGSSATRDPQGRFGQWQALDRELEERLNRLVIEHHEFGGRTGVNGPVPHIGFVSYDAR
jgi:sigma-E factor negative regulatory protein RseA